MDVKQVLRDFVFTSMELEEQSRAQRQSRQATKEAHRHVAALLNENEAVALEDDTFLVKRTPAPRVKLSEGALAAVSEHICDQDFGFIRDMAAGDVVPIKDIVTRAILNKLTHTPPPVTRVVRRLPRGTNVVELDEEQQQWVAACQRAVAAPVGSLRKTSQALVSQLQQAMPSATEPDFQRPIVMNVGEEQRHLVLRAVTKTKKPSMTQERLLAFLDALQSQHLDRVVSTSSVQPSELVALIKRIMPALVQAIKEWKASHAVVTMGLTVKDSS